LPPVFFTAAEGFQRLLTGSTGGYNAAVNGMRRIVIFLPNWLGDAVMATPALEAVRRHFRQAHIACLGRPAAVEVLRPADWIDEWIVDESAGSGRVEGFLGLVRRLSQKRRDLAILLPNSFRSALLARLGGCRRIAGYDRDARGWMLTDKLRPLRDGHGRFAPVAAIDYYLALIERLGIDAPSRTMSLPVSQAAERQAERILREASYDPRRELVMLNPGASYGVSKMWDAQRYAAVADTLIERRGVQIIVNAAPGERQVASRVVEAMKNPPLIDFAGRDNTVSLLKSLLRRCDLLITNDTGARHVAAAFGIAVVSIFGSTDPRWTEIYYSRERIVRADVPCSPCQRKLCPLPAGPTYHQCMTAVAPQMVLEAAQELLDRPGRDVRPAAQEAAS